MGPLPAPSWAEAARRRRGAGPVMALPLQPRTTEARAVPLPMLRAMRPQQWSKNLLVASAPLAAGRLADVDVATATVAAIICFCAASSAVYLFNDVCDIDA